MRPALRAAGRAFGSPDGKHHPSRHEKVQHHKSYGGDHHEQVVLEHARLEKAQKAAAGNGEETDAVDAAVDDAPVVPGEQVRETAVHDGVEELAQKIVQVPAPGESSSPWESTKKALAG